MSQRKSKNVEGHLKIDERSRKNQKMSEKLKKCQRKSEQSNIAYNHMVLNMEL